MIRLLLNHFFNALKSLQVQITTIIKPEKTKALLLFVLLMGLASNNVALGQQVDTWFRAGKGVNAPTSPLNYADPNPLPPADGTPVTTWYDIVYSVEQNLFPNPNPSDYPNNPFLTPPGFDYPFPNSGSYDLYLTPTGSIPGLPTLRRNLLSNINFNPVVNFDGSGDGQALHFRSDSRQNVTVFVVFRAQGAGNSAETQRLLFGGDVENHHTSFNQDQWTTNLSLGVADGNVFSVGRTWEGDGGGFFQPGSIDLMGLPSIGTFTRSASLDSERLDTYVNGLNDIGVDRNHILADNDLFFFNRVGKHFNSNDSNRNLTGDIAEILLADFSLSTTQRQMVESYLAIKYGITLNRAGQLGSIVGNLGYSYLASDGTVIWDPTLNINYRFDIAGLGRDRFDDTVGGLSLRYDQHQRISQSVNAGTIVAMSTNTNFATDNLDQSRTEIDNTTWGATSLNSHLHNYLIWASDRGSVNQTAVELPTGYSARIEREWQIQKTVSPGGVDPINNVSVRVDLSGSDMLSNPNCGTLVLLIDNDGDGDFLTGTLTSIPATSVDGANNAYFDNVTFEHTQVFTIAFLDDEDPTASNQVSTVCDNAPAVDPDVIDDETDNCGIASVTFISETTDNLSNPETIVRTYRVTDSYGNFIDVTHTIYVYTSPVVDEPADVSACNSYVLPPLTTGSYFTGSGGTGTPLSAGDVITSTQTIYVYAATGPVPCTDEHSFTVTITPAPVVDAGSDEEICQGGAHDLSNSGTVPTESGTSSLLWSSAGDGSFDDATMLAPTYTPGVNDIANGSVVLTLTGSGNGSCGPVNDSMTLTITPAPVVDAGSDEEICQGGAHDLSNSGTVPTESGTSSLLWSSAGDGSFDDATMLAPTYTPGVNDIANGSVVLTLTGSGNGSCGPVNDSMTLTITPAPVVGAGSDEEICQGGTHDFSASGVPPSASNTSALLWQTAGDGTFSDPNILLPVYTPGANDIANGSVVLTLRGAGNGSCGPVNDSMTLTITPAPVVDAGSDEEICQGGTHDLSNSGTVPTESGTSSLLWSSAGDGSFDDATMLAPTYTPGVNDIANGSVVLTLTGSGNGSCGPVNDSMTLTITPAPVVDAGSDEEICQGGAHDLSNSGTVPTESGTSSLLWSSAGDGSFDDATMLAPTYTPGVNDIANGSVVLTLTGSGNGSCGPVNDSMTLTITPAPIVDAGSDEEICQGGAHDLSNSGTVPTESGTSSLLWSSAGDGSFDDATMLAPTYTPGVNDIANGSVVLTLTGSGNGSCGPVNDSMTLTITPAPVVDAGSDEEICQGGTHDFSASGVPPSASNTSALLWQTAGDGTFSDPNILLPVYTPGANDIANGSVVLTLRGAGNGSCGPVNDSMTLTINDRPTIGVSLFSDPTSCSGNDGSITLIFTNVPNGNYDIVHDTGIFNAVPVNAGSAVVNGLTAGNYDNLRITVNGCTSTEDPDVTLTDPGAPIANAGSDGDVCGIGVGNPFATNAVAAVGTGTWTNETPLVGTATFADPNDETTNVTVDAYGTYTFRWTDVNGTCSGFDEITVTFDQQPLANAGPDQEICGAVPYVVTGASASGFDSLLWTHNGVGNFTDASVANAQYNPAPGDIGNVVTLTLTAGSSGSCTDAVDSMDLTITPEPVVGAGSDEEICQGGAHDLSNSGTVPTESGTSSLLWSSAGDGSFDDATMLAPTYTPGVNDIANGSVVLTLTGSGNGSCGPVNDSMTLTITPAPVVDAGSDEEICQGGTHDFSASGVPPSASNTSALLWQTAGDGTFSDPNILLPVYTPGANDIANGSVVLTLRGAGNGSCGPVNDSMELTINNTPLADAPADVESCDSYILPALANGNYFDAPNGGGNALSAGDVITATTTLYVFSPGAGSCPDVENSFVVTINNTPLADAPADVESCDSYILPALANGNYFDAPNGGGNALSAGDVITATTTLYVFSPGAGSCPDVENSFVVTINNTPLADAPADVESCDSYILPALANGNYFDAPNGGGNALSAGDVITATTTLYVFSPGAGSCPDVENSFVVTINNTPLADAPADVESCDSYILPALANGNYFDAPNGGGNALSAGDVITATTTLYVFSPGAGSCPDVENSFVVTINNTPLADAPADVESCDSYILPALANGNYFDAPNGGGNALSAGDVITATTTLYVFSPGAGSCPDVENSFVVTINNTPLADAPADVESCDSYILPALANGNYFDAPNGGGNALSAGDVITATTTLYVFSPGAGSLWPRCGELLRGDHKQHSFGRCPRRCRVL
ncbi:hypothetical protein [Flagellimonas sp.]|uniref:hypothetical protein n=1 Tax=Flagellimonas sp. TaxID=2058762 RepID=UPI003BA8D690